MLIKRTSLFSGATTERELDITEEQMARYRNGELIQDVFPQLSVDDREFILTGALPGEFEQAMAGMEDEGDGAPPNGWLPD